MGGVREGGAWKGVGERNPVPGTCDRWSARLSAMSADASEPESGPGSELGARPASEPGSEPGSGPGSEPGSGPGSGPASGPGSESGSGPGSGPASEPDQLCSEHREPLSFFCLFERRPVCAACARLGGRCHGHRIRRAEEHAEELRVSGLGAGNWGDCSRSRGAGPGFSVASLSELGG